MNKMFLTVVCASTIAFGATIANAAEKKEMLPPPHQGEEMEHPRPMKQDGKGPKFDKEMHKKMADKFAKDLGLSEEQKVEAKKIRKEGREKMKPLFKDMKELREKMDKVRESNMKEFEKILTPEQKAKLEKMKTDREEARKQKKAERMKKHDRGDHKTDADQSKNKHHKDKQD